MRLRLVRDNTNFDFFARPKLWLGISGVMMIVALISFAIQGLNYGIDFQGGTTIRTESSQPVDVASYRAALEPLELGDISITEVFDPNFRDDQFVSQIRIQAQEGEEAASGDMIAAVADALSAVDSGLVLPFPAVDSVGPTVSGELIQTAAIAVVLAILAVLSTSGYGSSGSSQWAPWLRWCTMWCLRLVSFLNFRSALIWLSSRLF